MSSTPSVSTDEYFDSVEQHKIISSGSFVDFDETILPGIIRYPEEENNVQQIRANYFLYSSAIINSAPAKSIEMVTLGPDLSERNRVSGETSPGILHNGNDEDQDGEKDGYLVYTFQQNDEPGLWRVIFIGEESAGARLRRNHANARLMPVNQKFGNSTTAPLDFPRLRQMWDAEPEKKDLSKRWYYDIGLKFETAVASASDRTLNATFYNSVARAARRTAPGYPPYLPFGDTKPDIVGPIWMKRFDPITGGPKITSYARSHIVEIKSTTTHQITSASYNWQILGEIDIAANSPIVGAGYKPMFSLITPSRTSINSPDIANTCNTVSTLTTVSAQHFKVWEIVPPQGPYRDNIYIGEPRVINGPSPARGPFLRGTEHFPK